MKRISSSILSILLAVILCSCAAPEPTADVVATTLPVYDFTVALCQDTSITVERLIAENVSCLHDYTLPVSQMRMLENADIVVISGAGLEDFLEDAMQHVNTVIDASAAVHLHHAGEAHADHADDPHIWLSPENACQMAQTICQGLTQAYPDKEAVFAKNLSSLLAQLEELNTYGKDSLATLGCRKLITFHDGFGYFAEAFDLEILRSVEEESGSEASASTLKELILLTRSENLPALFTETNGSTQAASVIAAETGVPLYALDMGLSGSGYFDTMYHNINTIKEALE